MRKILLKTRKTIGIRTDNQAFGLIKVPNGDRKQLNLALGLIELFLTPTKFTTLTIGRMFIVRQQATKYYNSYSCTVLLATQRDTHCWNSFQVHHTPWFDSNCILSCKPSIHNRSFVIRRNYSVNIISFYLSNDLVWLEFIDLKFMFGYSFHFV